MEPVKGDDFGAEDEEEYETDVTSTAGEQISKSKIGKNTKKLLDQLLVEIQAENLPRRNAGLFRREPANNVVTIRLTDTDYRRIQEMKELIGAKTISEVILQSLATFSAFVSRAERGLPIQVDLKEGNRIAHQGGG